MPEDIIRFNSGSFHLSGTVNVETVSKYRDSLVEMISASSTDQVEVELGEIEMQGSAVIALLISVLRESRNLNKSVQFQNPSEELCAIASACGVEEIQKKRALSMI